MGSSAYNYCECGNGGAKCIDCHTAQERKNADYGRVKHISGCICNDCMRTRIGIETCKCGHVGAECFNDSYCTPDSKADTESSADFWRKAYTERSSKATQDEIKLQNSVSSLENTCEHWEKTCDALQREHDERITELEAIERYFRDLDDKNEARISDLETTIRVLAGLLNG